MAEKKSLSFQSSDLGFCIVPWISWSCSSNYNYTCVYNFFPRINWSRIIWCHLCNNGYIMITVNILIGASLSKSHPSNAYESFSNLATWMSLCCIFVFIWCNSCFMIITCLVYNWRVLCISRSIHMGVHLWWVLFHPTTANDTHQKWIWWEQK